MSSEIAIPSVRASGLRGLATRLPGVANHLRDPLYLNSYYLMVGMGITSVTGFAFWLLAARLASVHEVGQAAGLFSAVLFLGYLTSFSLPVGVLHFLSGRNRFGPTANWAFLVSATTSVVASLVFCAGTSIWAPSLTPVLAGAGPILLFALFNASTAVGTLLDSLFAARRAARFSALRKSASGIARLALLPLMVASGGAGIYAANFLPVALMTILLLALLPRLLSGYDRGLDEEDGELRGFFSFSLGTFPSSLLSGAPLFALPLLLLSVLGTRQMAFFYVGWSISNILQLIPAQISQMSLSESSRDDPFTVAHRSRRFSISLVLPAVLVILALAPQILSLYGASYEEHATSLLRLLALSALPWAFVAIDLALLQAQRRLRTVSAVSAFYAVSTIALSTLLGALFGLEGIGIGWLAANLATAAVAWLPSRPPRVLPGALA